MLAPSDINVLMNQCRVELTGVSDALLKSTMYEVMDEFFRDTSSWREQIPFQASPTGISYAIAPTEGQIIRLDKVTDPGGYFVPALMEEIPIVVLKNAPNQPVQYTATVIKNVCLPLTREGYPIGPDWVLPKWHLAIKHGILGNLMNQDNKSYSSKKTALYNLSKFRQFIGNVRSAVLRANTSGAQAWRFPQSFRATTQKGGVPPMSGGERTF
jgi:hypothetical protein